MPASKTPTRNRTTQRPRKALDKGSAHRADSEYQTERGDEPSRANPLAQDIAGDIEQAVWDAVDCQEQVVVVAFHAKVSFEASEFGIACLELAPLAQRLVHLEYPYWYDR